MAKTSSAFSQLTGKAPTFPAFKTTSTQATYGVYTGPKTVVSSAGFGGGLPASKSVVGQAASVLQQQAVAKRAELARQAEIRERQRDLDVKAAALGQEQAAIVGKERQLESLRAKISEAARKPLTTDVYYNKLVSEYASQAKDLQARASGFNESVGKYNALAKGLSEQYQVQQAKELKEYSPKVELKRTPQGTLYTKHVSPETLAKQSFARQRAIAGVPLSEQFGLEARTTTKAGAELVAAAEERALSGKIQGLPGEYALQKATLAGLEQKRRFASTGPVPALGLSAGERLSLPEVEKSVAEFEKPTRKRVRLLKEQVNIPGAIYTTGELTGRKYFEFFPAKEPTRVTKFKETAKSKTAEFLGLQSYSVSKPEYSLFVGSKEERQQKFGTAAKGLTELASYELAFAGADIGLRFARSSKSLKSFDIGEAGAIGGGKKKPKLPEIAELGGYVKPVRKGYPEPLTIMPKGKVPELGKFLEPVRPLQYEEKIFLKSLKPSKPLKAIKKPIAPFNFPEPITVRPRGKLVKVPELGKFLEPTRPLQYEEKIFARTAALQKVKPFYKTKPIAPIVKEAPPTTAGLITKPQLKFEEFAKELKKVEVGTKVSESFKKTTYIPASYAALSVGLPRFSETPTEKLFKEEIDFLKPIAKEPIKVPAREEFKWTGLEFDRFSYAKPKTRVLAGFEYSAVKPKERFGSYLGLSVGTKQMLGIKTKEVLKPTQAVLPTISPILKIEPSTKTKASPRFALSAITREAQVSKTAEQSTQLFKEALKVTPKVATRISTRTITSPKIIQKAFIETPTVKIERGRIPIIPLFDFPRKAPKPIETFGYKVLVRGKGVKTKTGWKPGEFVPITQGVLPKRAAMAFGQRIVAGTAKRTFKLVPAIGKPMPIGKIPKFRPEMFYRKGRTYIEKTKFAIDMPGEKREITKAGISKLQGLRLTGFKPFRKTKKRKKKRR